MGYDNDARRNAARRKFVGKARQVVRARLLFLFFAIASDGKKRVARPIRARLNDRHS